MQINFAEACENTFIIIDKIDQSNLNDDEISFILKVLREENRDDALIIINGVRDGSSLTAKMLVLGQDGLFGEFCGNGARACAAYLYKTYKEFTMFFIRTSKFLHQLNKLQNSWFSVSMPKVSFEPNAKFIQGPLDSSVVFVDAVEPHLTLQGNLSDQQLLQEGRNLNSQKTIFPLGINLNAYQILDSNTISSKTYERGVQRLTKSCGTGSISCAAVFLKSSGLNQGCVNVITPGGPLKVVFDTESVELQGPAIA